MRKLLLIILFSTTLFFNPLGNVSADDPLRVGVYENRPLVFTDSKGEVQGIFIDILDHVAESENWTIDYQQCTWSRCLEMIEAGEIDLQVSIAYSAERAERYRFSEETVLLNWGQLYSREPAEIQSILDLEGKRVAVLEGDIHYQVLQELTENFKISPDFVRVGSYAEVFELLSRGEADAALCNRVFGAQAEGEYKVSKTSTIFNPLDIRFAASTETGIEALKAIDRQMRELRQDPDSLYYASLERWLGGTTTWRMPSWLRWGLGLAIGLALLFLVGALILRAQVRARTRDLEKEIVERVRTKDDLRQHTLQLEALRQVGLETTSQLDLDALLGSIVSRAIELVKGTAGGYSLYRPELDALEWAIMRGPDLPPAGIIIQRGDGLAGKIWNEGRSMIVADYRTWEGRSPSFADMDIVAVLGAPLYWGDEFLGVIEVLADRPGAFSPADARALELFATQAAIAIRNVRLYEQTAQRLTESQVLRAVMLAAASSLDFDQVLRQVCATLQTLMEVEFLTVVLVDETSQNLSVHPSSIGFSPDDIAHPLPMDQSITGRVFQTGEPIIIGDVRQIPHYLEAHPNVRSELAVPVRIGDRVIGVLDAESSQLNAYDQDDLSFYTVIAGQLGIVLENVQLYQREQRRRQEAETLREAALALATTLDRDEVVERILAQLQEVVPFDTASVQLLRGETLEIVGGHGLPNLPELLGLTFAPHGDNPNQTVMQTRQSFILEDAPAIYGDFHNEPHAAADIRSWLGVPMMVGEQMVGMLALDRFEPGFYTPEHAQLAEAFAAQAAIAIENAQLFEEVGRRVALMDALNAIITAMATVTDRDGLLDTALERAVEAMDVDKGAIWIGRRHATRNVVVAAGHRGTRQVRALTAPLAGTRAVEDWRAVENGAQLQAASLMADHEIRASLSTPITDDQQPIGGLLLAFSDVRSWSPEEVALIEVLGRQLAEAARRLQLQERSRKQAQQMEQILHSVPGGMLLLDAEKRVAVANPAAWNYLMVLADGSIGGTLIQLGNRPIGELLAPPAEGLWHEIVLREPEHWVFEVVARPVDEGPETEGWVLMIRDVTQEREIQKRTQQQEQLATVGQMAAGIAHDFNNILAVITLYAQILLRKPDLGPDIKDNLDTIHQQTIRAAELIQQILDFSRSAVLRPQALNLVPLLKEQVKLLSRTLPANIQLNVTYDSEKHLVHADPARMQQMVMNLALNARDAMPEGGTIEIGLEQLRIRMGERIPLPEMRSGDWAKVTVSDSGTGIPAEIEQHIFEPFFTTKAPGKGTGLGLSQVYGIVKQHGGHIDMSTKPGVGTTFTLYLPALPVEAVPEASPITTVLDHGAAETILVVEDNTVTRTAIVESLKVLNYQVLEAGDGLEALKVLEAGAAVQLVLTDLVMPKMGGRELIQVLRKRDAPVKIVAMTAHPLDDYMDELRAMGVVDWLHKPPSLKTLAEVIARALERQE